MRNRMQLTPLETGEPERRQQPALFTEYFLCDQLADANHLEAVIGIGNDIAVVPKCIENGKTVQRKTTETARAFIGFVIPLKPFEPLLAECQRRRPHALELRAHGKLLRLGTDRKS